jgi:tRNA(Arg) A34 adenosine deaminase TadA
MARAIELSVESVRRGGGPFGAVVVQNGKIIAEGKNQVTLKNDPSAHAEVTAIRAACYHLNSFQLSGCEIYSSCEPCPMCLGLIYWARPDKIYYANTAADAARIGFDDAHIYEELRRPPAKRTIPHEQIMHKEALVAFRAWGELPNKTTY